MFDRCPPPPPFPRSARPPESWQRAQPPIWQSLIEWQPDKSQTICNGGYAAPFFKSSSYRFASALWSSRVRSSGRLLFVHSRTNKPSLSRTRSIWPSFASELLPLLEGRRHGAAGSARGVVLKIGCCDEI